MATFGAVMPSPRRQLWAPARRAPIDFWQGTALLLVLGYFVMGRSFSYLGIPPLKIFIGEIALAAFVIVHPKAILDRVAGSLSRLTILSDYAWAFVLLLLYGIAEMFRGVYEGYSIVNAVQSLVFNYYPAYLFFGIWVSERNPTFVKRAVISLAWINGIYGALYIGFLSTTAIFIPGSQGAQVPIFGQPWGSPIAVLGILALNLDLKKTWFPLLLNAAVLLAMQVRAEWVGCAAGLFVYALLTKRFDKLTAIASVTGFFLIVGLIADVHLPGAASRGGGISTRDIVGRAIAPIDKDLAAEFTPFAKSNAATFEWRTNWWKAIWQDNYKNISTAVFGEGYGYPLVNLVPYLRGQTFLRTPHNMFFFALGYGGWLMVSLFVMLQAFLLRLLIRAWRVTGSPFGPIFWAAVVVWSFFGDSFETPYGAIPFFIMAGACVAPLFRTPKRYAYTLGA